MEEAIAIVQSVGFPIFVTIWFMVRTEKVIDRNTQAFIQFSEQIENRK